MAAITARTRRLVFVLDVIITGNLPVRMANRRHRKLGQTRLLLRRPFLLRQHWTTGQTWSCRRITALFRAIPAARNYLEIGVARGLTLENIRAHSRWAVDPNPRFDVSRLPSHTVFFHGTSDDFFAELSPPTHFDVVFVDGLHTFEQAYRDLISAFAHAHNGAVLLDDTVPCDAISAIPDEQLSLQLRREQGDFLTDAWHGDVWKVVACVARHHPELELRTIVDSGNPQTILWRRHPAAALARPTSDALRTVASMSYDDVFAEGVPAFFQPRTENAALADCISALTPRSRRRSASLRM